MDQNFSSYNIFAFASKIKGLENIFFYEPLLKERFLNFFGDVAYMDYEDALDSQDIIDDNDLKNFIKRLDKNATTCALLDILYKAADEVESLGFDEFRDKFLTRNEVENSFKNFGITDDEDEDDFSHKMGKFIKEAKDFYESKKLRNFLDFRARTAQFYEFCKKQNIRAFDYAMIIDMVTACFKAELIGEARYEKLLNRYGEKAMREFDGWDEFIASFMLGALYAKGGNDEDDDESQISYEDNFSGIYDVLVMPNDIFKMSGIWRDSIDSAKQKLIPVLENYLGEEKAREQKEKFERRIAYYERELGELRLDIRDFSQIMDIFYQDVFTELKKVNSIYYFDKYKLNRFMTPLITLSGEASLCDATLKILNGQALKRDELPVELPIMTFKNALVTTKGIYVQNGFLFFKKLKRVAWADVNFSIKRFGFDEFICNINNEDSFNIPLALNEDAMRRSDFRDTMKELLTQDMQAFELAFENLKKRFK